MRSPDVPRRAGSSSLRRALGALVPIVALVSGALAPSAGAVDDTQPAPTATDPTPTATDPTPTATDPPPPPVTDPPPPATDPPPVTDPPPATDPPPVTDPPPATDPPPVTDPPPPVDSVPVNEAPRDPRPSTSAIDSWGTAKADGTSKAQRVNAIVEADGIAYLGGEFTKMVDGGSSVSRGYLAAVDGETGDLKSWNPRANKKVFALELSADRKSVYVGGDFTSIAGKTVSRLVKIDLKSGELDRTFRPAVKGRVRGLALAGERLYVGGEFLSIGGKARPKLAAVDPVTGDVLPWTPPPLGQGRYLGHTGIPTPDYSAGHVFAVEAIGGKVFAAGNFTNLGGEGGLVTLDATTGALAEPQFDPGRPMFDLDTAGGVLYAAGGGPGGRLVAYRVDKKTPLWKVKVDGDAVGVAASDTAVYLAGHYDYVVSKDSSCYQFCPGGPRRHHILAVNRADGQLLPWNPDIDTSTGPFTVTVGRDAVYVGGEFNKINFESQPGFTVFPGTR